MSPPVKLSLVSPLIVVSPMLQSIPIGGNVAVSTHSIICWNHNMRFTNAKKKHPECHALNYVK
jgi:hypothetical protein